MEEANRRSMHEAVCQAMTAREQGKVPKGSEGRRQDGVKRHQMAALIVSAADMEQRMTVEIVHRRLQPVASVQGSPEGLVHLIGVCSVVPVVFAAQSTEGGGGGTGGRGWWVKTGTNMPIAEDKHSACTSCERGWMQVSKGNSDDWALI